MPPSIDCSPRERSHLVKSSWEAVGCRKPQKEGDCWINQDLAADMGMAGGGYIPDGGNLGTAMFAGSGEGKESAVVWVLHMGTEEKEIWAGARGQVDLFPC